MLHVASVHFGSPDWIEIQSSHLREHLSVPYETWTSLEGIDPSYGVHFDHVVDQAGRHSDKLNHLAIEICHTAGDDDLLMFLDGDAFPIADPMPLIRSGLSEGRLVAIRRAENLNDLQPHPCFCVTTVGAWRELGGDWSAGYRWTDSLGRRVTDVGGNLLRQLELTETPWTEVLRSNARELDPIFFGLYGDVIYHHGAGFRASELTRVHHTLAPAPLRVPALPVIAPITRRVNKLRRGAWERRKRRELVSESLRIFSEIKAPGEAWVDAFR